MAKKKEIILRKFAKDTLASLSTQAEEVIEKERKGIREGTKGLSGARIIDISRIKPDSDQPRKSFDQKTLKELAGSIKEHGLLQPITVEYVDYQDYFKIINGKRRYEAAKLAGLSEIPCIIKDIDKYARLIHQLIENIQRQALPVLEEAKAIQTLIDNRRMENSNYSQREAAKDLGLPKTYLNEMLT
ncbi:ParB/RepB/Spo0J family partition protein, partial [Patescibacteria group bacterium]|nr:ParB/RepB/Spo0J family partition protein [Patescibacteria group bacterium]